MQTIYLVAREMGAELQFWTGHNNPAWTPDPDLAAWTADIEQADRDAAAWSDYWATKGYGHQHAMVATYERDEPEANA